MLAEAEPATIIEALRQLRDGEPNLLQKILAVAGNAIEARIGKMIPDPAQTQKDEPVGIKVTIPDLLTYPSAELSGSQAATA